MDILNGCSLGRSCTHPLIWVIPTLAIVMGSYDFCGLRNTLSYPASDCWRRRSVPHRCLAAIVIWCTSRRVNYDCVQRSEILKYFYFRFKKLVTPLWQSNLIFTTSFFISLMHFFHIRYGGFLNKIYFLYFVLKKIIFLLFRFNKTTSFLFPGN